MRADSSTGAAVAGPAERKKAQDLLRDRSGLTRGDAELFVSVHTVELHLSHAHAKLGVRSRSRPLTG
jgi:hypothetical protein